MQGTRSNYVGAYISGLCAVVRSPIQAIIKQSSVHSHQSDKTPVVQYGCELKLPSLDNVGFVLSASRSFMP